MAENLDLLDTAVSLLVRVALLAARFSGRVRGRSLRGLGRGRMILPHEEIAGPSAQAKTRGTEARHRDHPHQAQLEYLAGRVRKLQRLTRKVCQARIESYTSAWLHALQEEFFSLKEGRIRLIGEQLKGIQTEIGKRDLSGVNTDKLLELQLRYFEEPQGEYVETGPRTKTGPKLNSSEICEQLQSVLGRYRTGEVSEPQAKLEQAVLQSMLKAIEQTELAAKLERLTAVMRTRS